MTSCVSGLEGKQRGQYSLNQNLYMRFQSKFHHPFLHKWKSRSSNSHGIARSPKEQSNVEIEQNWSTHSLIKNMCPKQVKNC